MPGLFLSEKLCPSECHANAQSQLSEYESTIAAMKAEFALISKCVYSPEKSYTLPEIELNAELQDMVTENGVTVNVRECNS